MSKNTPKPKIKSKLDEAQIKAILADQETFSLDNETITEFLNAMHQPKEPNNYLKQAAKTYQTSDKGNGTFDFPLIKNKAT